MKTKIVLLTDSQLIAEGFARMLAESPSFSVVSTVYSIKAASQAIIKHRAPLLVMDPWLIDYLNRDNVRILFPTDFLLSIVALVSRYVEQSHLKQYQGVIELTDGRRSIEHCLHEALIALETEDVPDADGFDLSERERDVLVAIAKGMQNKAIADNLNISVHTVISHRKNIISKIGIKSVAGLTVYALMNGLIEESEVI